MAFRMCWLLWPRLRWRLLLLRLHYQDRQRLRSLEQSSRHAAFLRLLIQKLRASRVAT